jgi:hypothetical protein
MYFLVYLSPLHQVQMLRNAVCEVKEEYKFSVTRDDCIPTLLFGYVCGTDET